MEINIKIVGVGEGGAKASKDEARPSRGRDNL